jgi:UDP:flavonoid glycosyltransferase YjiC (YdhE family)
MHPRRCLHFILSSLGTDGDILPYVGLGAKLLGRGHRVTLVAAEPFHELAAAHGLEFRALITAEENHQLLANPDFWHPWKGAVHCARWGVRFMPRQYNLFSELASQGEPVLVVTPALFAAAFVHEKKHVPLVNLLLQPWMIPSSVAPPVMAGLPLPRWAPPPVWQLLWRAIDVVGDVLLGGEVNRLRRSIGLPHIRRILGRWFSSQLVLGMFPEWFGSPALDWPRQVRLMGFPLFEGNKGQTLPADLAEFLQAGQPPVVFTFGTGMMHAEPLFRRMLVACEQMGARALFLTRYREQLPEALPPFARHCRFAPFQQLLPRCSAVVHHGGIGTLATALSSGTPQLILPFAFDQADNAARARNLGVAESLDPRRASPAQVANALRSLLTPETKARCRIVAARLGTHDALAMAAEAVENLEPHGRIVVTS